jgi:hypothetical protein
MVVSLMLQPRHSAGVQLSARTGESGSDDIILTDVSATSFLYGSHDGRRFSILSTPQAAGSFPRNCSTDPLAGSAFDSRARFASKIVAGLELLLSHAV